MMEEAVSIEQHVEALTKPDSQTDKLPMSNSRWPKIEDHVRIGDASSRSLFEVYSGVLVGDIS
jgi:hypothetical protein